MFFFILKPNFLILADPIFLKNIDDYDDNLEMDNHAKVNIENIIKKLLTVDWNLTIVMVKQEKINILN